MQAPSSFLEYAWYPIFFENINKKTMIFNKFILINDKQRVRIKNENNYVRCFFMKRGSTLFLKLAVIILGIPILALCVYLLPQIANVAFEEAANGARLGYMVLGILFVMYVSAIPFYTALYQAFKLLTYIDKNQAFSQMSVEALRKIKNCAIAISGLYVVVLPFVFMIAEWDDAPGLALLGLVIIGASMVIAVFAAVLQRLLQEAIDIKTENDLTV